MADRIGVESGLEETERARLRIVSKYDLQQSHLRNPPRSCRRSSARKSSGRSGGERERRGGSEGCRKLTHTRV